MSLRNMSRAKVILSIFIVNAVVFALCMLFFVPKAINNDDYIIHGITSGAYGIYSDVTVHTNVIFARLLVFLQQTFSNINWFAVIEEVVCYLSFSICCSVAVLTRRNITGVSTAIILGVFIAPDFYLLLHNTKLTTFVATAGLIALMYGIRNRCMFLSIAGWITALVSSFIRLNAFLIGAVIALVLGFIWMLEDCKAEDRKEKKSRIKEYIKGFFLNNRRLLRVLFIFFLSVITFVIADICIVDRIDGGRDYREYNEVRGAISDFELPDYDEHIEEYIDLGISRNDYEIIRSWNFADLEKFDLTTLRGILSIEKRNTSVFKLLMEQFTKLIYGVCFILLLVMITLAFIIGSSGYKTSVILSLMVFLACLAYMTYIGRFTHWVLSGILGSLFAVIGISFQMQKNLKKSALTTVCISLMLLGAILSVLNYNSHIGRYQDSFHPSAADIYLELGDRSSNLYLIDHATGPAIEIHQIIPTFSSLPKDIYINSYSLGGWDTESPVKNSILMRYGVTGSPYRALLEKDNVFLVDVKNYEQKLTYIRENYDSNATMSMVDVVDGYYVFAFTASSSGFVDVVLDKSLKILETAVSVDETNTNFIYLGVKVEEIYDSTKPVYLKLTNRIDDTSAYYRARVVEGGGGYAAVTSLRMYDLLIADEYTVAVVQKTNEGYISTDSVSLSD